MTSALERLFRMAPAVVASDEPESLDRLARAAERIADSPDVLVRARADSRELPKLRVARAHGDSGATPPAHLKPDGVLFINVRNDGGGDTRITEPSLRVESGLHKGEFLEGDARPHRDTELVGGAHVLLQFRLGPSAHSLAGSALQLLLPHTPGQYGARSVTEVDLEPVPWSQGIAGWRPFNRRGRPAPS